MFKKRKRKTAKNYGPVTLMNTDNKLYAEISRMAKNFERDGKLGETQMGFRKVRGMKDAIYLLKTVIGKNLKRE